MHASPSGTKPTEVIPYLHGNFCHEYFSDMHDEIERLTFAEEIILDPCGHGREKSEVEKNLQCKECKVLATGFVQNNSKWREEILDRLKSLRKGICPDRADALRMLFLVVKNYKNSYISSCGHSVSVFKLKRGFGRLDDITVKVNAMGRVGLCEECKTKIEFYLPNGSLRKIVDILSRILPFSNKPVYLSLHPYLAQQLYKVPLHHTKYMINELIQTPGGLDIVALNRVLDGCNNFINSGKIYQCEFVVRREFFLFLYRNLENQTEYQKFSLLPLAVNVLMDERSKDLNIKEICLNLVSACKFVSEEPKFYKQDSYNLLKSASN